MADPISWIAIKVSEWVAMSVFQVASNLGLSITTAATIANVAYGVSYGLVYAGSFALGARLSRPNLPDPGEGTEPLNESRPESQMGTGRARISGKRSVWESIPGWNIDIIEVHEGPVDGFEKFWLNDDEVTLDEDGWVQPLENGRYGDQCIRILTRRGAHDDAPFQEIIDLCVEAGLPELYGENHWGRGVAKIAVLMKAVDDADVIRVYPNGPPKASALTRMSRVYDWRDPAQDLMDPSTWLWSETAVVNHVHWEWCLRFLPVMVGEAGWIQGDGRPPPDICLEAWETLIAPHLDDATIAADICDEAVPLKAGGTEPRYRQGGWWRCLNPDADIRKMFQDCYDGWMVESGLGALKIKAGRYEEPTYELIDRHMKGSTWAKGSRDREQTNILIAKFVSPEHGWLPQHSEAWRDDSSIAAQGEERPDVFELIWVSSHAQARRLLKRRMALIAARRQGKTVMDMSGLNALERRYVFLNRKFGPASMRGVPVEIRRALTTLTSGRVPLDVIQADPNIDQWNELTEEGTAPTLTPRAPRVFAPQPVVISVTPETSGGITSLRIKVEDPSRPGLKLSGRWRVTGAVSWKEGDPQTPDVVTGGLEIVLIAVEPTGLDVECAFWTGGERGDWSVTETTDAEPSDDPVDVALAAWLDAIPNQPSPTRAGHYHDFIATLRPGDPTGAWEQLDDLWLDAAHDSPSSLIGLKGRRQASIVGAVDFLASRGHQGDGSTGKVDTGVDPSTGGLQFTRNAGHQGVWCLTEGADSTPVCGNTQSRIIPRNASDNIVIRANSASSASVATASALGHTCWVRDGASSTRLFRNGVMVSAGASASADFIPGEKLWICGSDNTGTDSFSTMRIAAFHIGGALTDAQAADLHDALETYLTAVGAL